jgi:hypothetical protein
VLLSQTSRWRGPPSSGHKRPLGLAKDSVISLVTFFGRLSGLGNIRCALDIDWVVAGAVGVPDLARARSTAVLLLAVCLRPGRFAKRHVNFFLLKVFQG